jgi:hypothetical protein
MSENEKDLSVYLDLYNASLETWRIFAGFLFTSVTILVTWLPNPSEIQSQIALFFLSVLFYLALSAHDLYSDRLYFCIKYAPKFPEGYNMKKVNRFVVCVAILFGLCIPLLFVLRGLTYLSVASIIAYAISFIPQRRWSQKYTDYAVEKWKRISLYEDEN